jgi:hypothetical protein
MPAAAHRDGMANNREQKVRREADQLLLARFPGCVLEVFVEIDAGVQKRLHGRESIK